MKLEREKSSFRDNKATVFFSSGRIFRKVIKNLNLDYDKLLSSKFFIENKNQIVSTKILTIHDLNELNLKEDKEVVWLEHEKLENIIYPYELTFDQLKDYSIFFLNLYLSALKNSYDIIDASAYNIQLKNNLPIFIDLGSFTDYQGGTHIIWHKQFCENFLAPLLIKSKASINFNDFFKANIDGIDLKIASKILPLSTWFNYNILINIHLQSYLSSKISSSTKLNIAGKKNLNIRQKIFIAENLKKTISKLSAKKTSYWSSYSKVNSYSDDDYEKKSKIISNFIKNEKIYSLIDLGCNDGYFSKISFNSGVKKIVGVDYDLDSLNDAYLKFKSTSENFSAIYQNFTNTSPDMGWMGEERKSFLKRFKNKFDGMICLAFIHHICVGNNVPLSQFIDYIGNFSKNILLEFVSNEDQMVKNLSINKKNLMKNYTLENLKKIIKKNNTIISENQITATRFLIHYKNEK